MNPQPNIPQPAIPQSHADAHLHPHTHPHTHTHVRCAVRPARHHYPENVRFCAFLLQQKLVVRSIPANRYPKLRDYDRNMRACAPTVHDIDQQTPETPP